MNPTSNKQTITQKVGDNQAMPGAQEPVEVAGVPGHHAGQAAVANDKVQKPSSSAASATAIDNNNVTSTQTRTVEAFNGQPELSADDFFLVQGAVSDVASSTSAVATDRARQTAKILRQIENDRVKPSEPLSRNEELVCDVLAWMADADALYK
jgi:hypothetical protein